MTAPTFAHTVTLARSVTGKHLVRHSWRVTGSPGWRHAVSKHTRREAASARAEALRRAFCKSH